MASLLEMTVALLLLLLSVAMVILFVILCEFTRASWYFAKTNSNVLYSVCVCCALYCNKTRTCEYILYPII